MKHAVWSTLSVCLYSVYNYGRECAKEYGRGYKEEFIHLMPINEVKLRKGKAKETS